MNDDVSFTPVEPEPGPGEIDPVARRSGGRGRRAAALGTIVAGGILAAAMAGPLAMNAASPSPAASGAPTASGDPANDQDNDANDGGMGFGNHGFRSDEAVSDLSVVAKAIGITEADLQTALDGGQTVAAVAKAHNVDAQKVIDALVKDGLDELAAAVKAGTITQAQADAEKAEVTQRATDQVNGTMMGRGHGGGFGGGHGRDTVEAVSDLSVAAKAIGITEADLQTALDGGQSLAAVAKAHNVTAQKVIDGLVQDELDELAAAVKAGTITQAQADTEKSEVTTRITDRVNGTWTGRGGPGGDGGGHGSHGGHH